jgi:uncharacterized DUF497 family protein
MENRIVEFDPAKERINLRKHGVSFDEAITVFADAHAVVVYDDAHAESEDRFRIIGYSHYDRMLLVAYTDRVANRFRLISARRANRTERRLYEEERS